MIPVKRFPKTTSGKLQRRLLADDYLKGEYDDILRELQELDDREHAGMDDHLTATERKVKDICDEVLKDKKIHRDDNFFEVGISSLALAEIHMRIDDVYPDIVDVTDLFDHQTIAQVAAFIDNKG